MRRYHIIHDTGDKYYARIWRYKLVTGVITLIAAIFLFIYIQHEFNYGSNPLANTPAASVGIVELFNSTSDEKEICWKACETIDRPAGPTDNVLRIESSTVFKDGEFSCRCKMAGRYTYIIFEEAVLRAENEYPIFADRVENWLECKNTVNMNCGRAPVGWQDITEKEDWVFDPKLY